MGRRVGLWVALFLSVSAGASQAGEFYYVMVFGSQSHPKQLRYTHTWATFIRAVGEGEDPNGYALEYHTISWYPASMKVKVWKLRPEPGVNLTLEQSLDAVYANGERVTMWGPFMLRREGYERALGVIQKLESGDVLYRAISTRFDLEISDCIHAVAAVDPVFGRAHYPLIRVGHPASRYIARQIMTRTPRVGLTQEEFDNTWLIPRLGLDQYPIRFVAPQVIPRRGCFLCVLPD